MKNFLTAIALLFASSSASAATLTIPYYDSIEGWLMNDGTVVVRSWAGTTFTGKPPAHVAADWLLNLRRGPEWLKLIEIEDQGGIDGGGKIRTIRTWPADVWPYQ